jgi:hypothetical protein
MKRNKKTQRFQSEIKVVSKDPLLYKVLGVKFCITNLIQKSKTDSDMRGFVGFVRTPGWTKVRVTGLLDESNPELLPLCVVFMYNGKTALHAPGHTLTREELEDAMFE